MGVGVEGAIARYIAEKRGYGVWDDPDRSRRVVFVQFQPPVPPPAGVPNDGGYETLNTLAVTVFQDGGLQPQRDLLEPTRITIQCRHPRYEIAWAEQHAIHQLLHENGGATRRPDGTGRFPGGVRIGRITADFPPLRLGRDQSSRDGRALTTQTFLVRVVAPIPLT